MTHGAGAIYERFDRIVAQQGEHQAVAGVADPLSYAELAARSSAIAGDLIEREVGVGDRVALLFDRESAAFAALLAVFRIGAIAVPLVASHPHERLRHIIEDADPRVLLTNGRHVSDARTVVGARVQILECDQGGAPARIQPVPSVDASSAALILYTSGSTGTPKGVLQTHDFILNKLERVRPILRTTAADRVTFFSSYALGQGATTIVLSLLSGATICPFDVRRDGLASLVRWLGEEHITTYLSSATLLRNIMRTMDGPHHFADLRLVRIGGERVTVDDVAAARRLFPNAQLVVNYSSTECGSIAMNPIDADQTFVDGVVPVGRPFGDLSVQILDDEGRELPTGESGEIAVRSTQLASGYWRDPERTARMFVPMAGTEGARLYRTGDLGCFGSDGLLAHLGRKDLRVKIRGFRIEIEEVEKVLNQDPAVLRAAVAAKPDGDGDLRLVAYVQGAPGSEVTVDALRALMSLRLPEHMIPSTFVIMDQLPMTDSTKVARYLLPDPPPDRPPLATPSMAPRSELEGSIADVWRDVLGLDTVGVHDAFLSIGGDSLKATLVASRLTAKVGIELPLWVLFEASTVAELAVAIEGLLAARSAV